MNSAVIILTLALFGIAVDCRTFKCDQVWSNASSDNSPTDCFTDTAHMQTVLLADDVVAYTILAVLPIVLLLVFAFACPFVCCGRYCCNCCGGYQRQPGTGCCGDIEQWKDQPEAVKNANYPRGSVVRTKCCAFVLLFLACVAVPLGLSGTILLQQGYNDFFGEAKGVLGWALGQSTQIRTLMTINTTGQLIPPLQESMFDDIGNITADLGTQIDDTKSSADQVASELVVGTIILFAASIIFMALTALAACLNIRSCLLCCNSACYYIFFIVFGLIGSVFLLLGLVLGGVCGERDLFLRDPTAPGLFSLALVPVCTQNFPFESIEGDVRAVILQQAQASCTAMDGICSQTAAYDAARPREVFHCPTLANPTTDCRTFGAADAIGNSMTLKSDAPGVRCVNNSVTVTPCTLERCGEICNEPNVRDDSATASTSLGFASNAEIAFNVFVAPLLSCNQLYAQILGRLESCDTITESLNMAGAAAFLMEVLLFAGIIGIWRGQKRFIPASEAAAGEPEEPFTDVKNEPYPDDGGK